MILFQELSLKILELVGGKENVVSATNCMTRLRVNLKDYDKADIEALKAVDGVLQIIQMDNLHVVLGPGKAKKVTDQFKLDAGVTAAIGVPLSEMAGGITPITTAAIVVTVIDASVLGPMLCKWFHLTDDIAKGAAYGTAGHVVGTSKAMEHSALAGAASSLSLVVAGLLTAVVFPILTSLL